jgi:hypothetical protein
MAIPEFCHAENASNFFHFGPGELFIIGAIVALPSAILCVLAEAIFSRRRLPLWLTGLSAVAAVVSIALAVVAMNSAMRQNADLRIFLWFIVPPLVALALRGSVSARSPRLAAGWVIAVASLGLAAGRQTNSEAAGVLAGGAAVCLLFWTIIVLILRARRVFPAESPNAVGHVTPLAALSEAARRLAGVGAALSRALSPVKAGSWSEQLLARFHPAQSGLTWWLASACVLYFGIGAAISTGKLGGGGWLYVEWQYVADLFGLRYPKEFRPTHVWWVFGLPWSLFAGSAFWGLAGLLGGFDPGRARIVRFAAIVFGGALLVWTASIISQMAEVDTRERQADGAYR